MKNQGRRFSDKTLFAEQRRYPLLELGEVQRLSRLWETKHRADNADVERRAQKYAARLFAAARRAIREAKL